MLSIIRFSFVSFTALSFSTSFSKSTSSLNNSKESEIEIQSEQTNYQLETSNYEFADPVDLFDLQVSPQYICEEDNEMESENEILCTPQSKRLRKSNKRKSYEYY
jgi:hypothetical protein